MSGERSPRAEARHQNLVEALKTHDALVAVELRPPRAALSTHQGIDAWIDTYHSVRTLVRQNVFVFLTDSAVGAQEEDNLRHLVINLGTDVPRSHVVPFLTSKHTREYCLSYADRARQHGFPALVVLGGDKSVGPPRCVEHASQLRSLIRAREPDLLLGGWANPHADPVKQVDFLLAHDNAAEFFLTQIVSHHQAAAVERFAKEAARRNLTIPGLFGVFYYRSANAKTLSLLSEFLPVPADGVAADFASGLSAVDVCAKTLKALWAAGARHVYISNLPLTRTHATLAAILEKAGR